MWKWHEDLCKDIANTAIGSSDSIFHRVIGASNYLSLDLDSFNGGVFIA